MTTSTRKGRRSMVEGLMQTDCSKYMSSAFLVTLVIAAATMSGAYSQTTPSCNNSAGCFPDTYALLDLDTYPARTVSVSSTCGDNTTNGGKYKSLVTSDAAEYTCNASELQLKNLFDNDESQPEPTYWQSANMINVTGAHPNPQYLIFNFTDEVLITLIDLTFIAPSNTSEDSTVNALPAALSLQKMDSISPDWVTLHYFAANCTKSFPGIPLLPSDTKARKFNITYCQKTSLDDDNFLVYSPLYVFDKNYKNNMAAIARFSATALRVYITAPASGVPLMSYVAISDIYIEGQCKCFGHASSCGGSNGATCDCNHNTTGQKCDVCQPLYNNRAWLPGNVTNAGQCLECTCNGYADTCVYDTTKGTGVCINCTDNTVGDRCDTCTTGFYLNPKRAAVSNNTAEPFCLACNCNQNGTLSLSTDISPCDVTTGQCRCKERVTQRDCSECNDTYWGLAGDKPLGCDVCACNTAGTINSTNVCDKATRACVCKQNVEGATCNQCKNLTFIADSSKPLSCTLCDCDPGASSQLSCDVASGQCTCYGSHLGGRDCRSLTPGFFVPRLDYIIIEPENLVTMNVVLRSGHGTAGSTVSGTGFVKITAANQTQFTFTATYSGPMEAVVRYEKIIFDSSVSVRLTLTTSGNYSCNGNTITAGQSWTLDSTNTQGDIRAGLSVGKVCLNAGTSYTAVISTSGSAMLVDSLVFIPDAASFTALTDRMDLNNITTCIQMARDAVRSNRDICAKVEYSLMAYLLKGAVACSPASGAISSSQCDSFSGDGPCLTGVLPPDCSKCKADYFQFSLTNGCTACGCHQNGSLSDLCDSTGVCSCRPNVQGSKCDACIPEFYGLYTKTGCAECKCNPKFSFNNSCNDYGDCPCKPGVKGPLCESCMNGFYNLTVNGCTQCGCNLDGSTGRACDVTSGSCECLPSVEGSTCSNCKKGTFGLGKWNPNGCIPCFCWGHGQVCASAEGWYNKPVTSSWPTSFDVWSAQDAEGNSISVQNVSAGSQNAMKIDPDHLAASDIYFVAPGKFLGDRKSSYGRYITIALFPFDAGNNTEVQLSGAYTNYTLVYSHSGTINNLTLKELTFQIPILERQWEVKTKVVSTSASTNITTTSFTSSGNASYYQLLETLSNLASFRIKAFTANSSQVFNLLSVTLEGGTTNNVSSTSVSNVEMCDCERGYTGSSCQNCAPGYTRVSPNATHPGTLCVPCRCNGHGITACDQLGLNCSNETVIPCDPVTGVCTCRHNTTGDHCQFCKTGYYGNATKGTSADCLPCACPGLIVRGDFNVFANSCSLIGGQQVCDNCTTGHTGSRCEICSNGYFGTPENDTNNSGKCINCECNGRADTCDGRTGKCVACRNNTAGQNCDICDQRYFGDAINSTCQSCACENITGSTGLCNHTTGVCECLPNVAGPSCTLCNDLGFNLTAGIGCQLCECSADGSTSTACDKISGQCICRNLVTGRKCDKCQDGYWNVNNGTGCDPCSCNTEGTAKYDNGTVQQSCDVKTGQCNCALPGIVGRTCDSCSPVSKSVFQYVRLFHIGDFPQCVLCGNCFDSWAETIDNIGKHLHEMDLRADIIWGEFDNQTSEQVRQALTNIEEKINSTNVLLSKFEALALQLEELQNKSAEAHFKHSDVSNEIDYLTNTANILSAELGSLLSVTEVVPVSDTVNTSLSSLGQELVTIVSAAELSANQGNSSFTHIQTLSFVVASPEEREQNLRNQAKKSMESAALVNQTYNTLKKLYETSLTPGANQRASDLSATSEKLNNVSALASEVAKIVAGITLDVDSVTSNVTSLLAESTRVRADILDSVMKLQQYVTNATSAQRAADKALKDALNYKSVAERAEKTMRDSMTALLESITSLNQAETDLNKAKFQSLAVVLIQIPALADMQNLVKQIQDSKVSAADVADLNLLVQQALYDATEALKLSQKALTLTRELNEEIQLMKTDVADSKDLRSQVDSVLTATNDLNTTINSAIMEAAAHSDQADANVSAVTQLANDAHWEVTNITACITQLELDAYNAENAATQVNDRAETSMKKQLALLEVMKNINTQEIAATMIPPIGNLTQADTTVKKMKDDLILLEQFANMETLIQELLAQDKTMQDLDNEVTQLTATLDSIILALKESTSGTSCTNT